MKYAMDKNTGIQVAAHKGIVDFQPIGVNTERVQETQNGPITIAEKVKGVVLITQDGQLCCYNYSNGGRKSDHNYTETVELKENEKLVGPITICPKNKIMCVLTAGPVGESERMIFFAHDIGKGFKQQVFFNMSDIMHTARYPLFSNVLHSYQGKEVVGVMLYNDLRGSKVIGYVYDTVTRNMRTSSLKKMVFPKKMFTRRFVKFRKNGLATLHNRGNEIVVFSLKNRHIDPSKMQQVMRKYKKDDEDGIGRVGNSSHHRNLQ
jgi:hypothetical protein